MERLIKKLIENAFDMDKLEEALENKINDWIDYDEIADDILSNYSLQITDYATEIAEELC